jgi:hypothetical protein
MGLLVVISTLALLPPLEFFTQAWARDDLNYQQQATVAGMSLIGGIAILIGFSRKWSMRLRVPLAIAIVVSAGIGLMRAYDLMTGFQIGIAIGPGLPSMLIIIIMLLLFYRMGENT